MRPERSDRGGCTAGVAGSAPPSRWGAGVRESRLNCPCSVRECLPTSPNPDQPGALQPPISFGASWEGLVPVAPTVALITQRSLVQIQPPQPSKSMGCGTHAVARWFFRPTFGSRSPLKHWSSADGPSGRLRTVRCGPRWCDSRGDIPCISRQGVDMTGPRDALAGRVIPPAGFAARTYSVARYARTAPSTTSAICRARSPIPQTWQPEPRGSTSTRLLRPSQG